jgi:hypothetical protein
MRTLYIDPKTGIIDDYDGWWYETPDGNTNNAVELDEVIEISKEDLIAFSWYLLKKTIRIFTHE